ncbi:dUTP diphosphatase [Thermosulfurimonas dismutans]|uniref:dUTP diphosphatase n=1 Tax=Thermosulfurimonas dismutans TaxID=999894 RepID=A0A179D6A6_9BACT|nr:dUTP diphosphatase [Thermosulfurimonas dismutans]OAQ21635.1 Deoxyuridine 5'-triphosphate nucleotidohydrolase [Thermosulfurimonas dismutans]
MELKVWRRDPRARLPEKASEGAVGFDLFALEDQEILPGEPTFIRTGLVIEAPRPYAMFVFPRSSLFRKKGLIFPHSAGVIDFDYCGEEDELKILVLNLREEPVKVLAGERIAQLVLLAVATEVKLREVPRPPRSISRGGFGSTGGYR